MSYNLHNLQMDKPTDLPPTQPHDPVAPDADPLPLPPDDEPHAPVREPDAPMPAGDPQPGEPPRLLLLQI